MTLVTKSIRGQKYYYFQDSVKTNSKVKVINTLVSRADIEGSKLLQYKQIAHHKHFLKLLRTSAMIKRKPYRYENIETKEAQFLNDSFEMLKLINQVARKSLSASELDGFEKTLFTRYVYCTTAIEGNTLTEEEAYNLLSADLTPRNKSVNETLEVSNYTYVKEYVEAYSGGITENFIKRVHKLLMNGIRGSNGKLIEAGEYRTGQAILQGIAFKPPHPELIHRQMKYIIADYNSKLAERVHPIEIASYFHQKFEEIHPFQDGNGRVGREILNYILTQNGFPPIYVTPKQRSSYLTALQEGNTENYTQLFLFILGRLTASIQYLFAKTTLYNMFTSEKAIEEYEEAGTYDILKEYIEIIKKFHNTDEIP